MRPRKERSKVDGAALYDTAIYSFKVETIGNYTILRRIVSESTPSVTEFIKIENKVGQGLLLVGPHSTH